MKAYRLGAFLIAGICISASGCAQNGTPAPDKEAKIKTALDQLDPDDRKLAEQQKYCAIQMDKRLGSMGKPIKVMVEDQPVLLCCEGCEKPALKNPVRTLAAVKRLKKANSAGSEENHHE